MKHQSQWTYYHQLHHLGNHPLPVQVMAITNYSGWTVSWITVHGTICMLREKDWFLLGNRDHQNPGFSRQILNAPGYMRWYGRCRNFITATVNYYKSEYSLRLCSVSSISVLCFQYDIHTLLFTVFIPRKSSGNIHSTRCSISDKYYHQMVYFFPHCKVIGL